MTYNYYKKDKGCYNKKLNYTINLSFFAGDSAGDKTEKATPKKKKDARKEGQVVHSPEITTAFTFIIIFSIVGIFASSIIERIENIYFFVFNDLLSINNNLTIEHAYSLIVYLFKQVIFASIPIFITAILIGIIVNVAQVGWQPTSKPLKPKFSKINPLKGFKRIFSLNALVELIKSLLKFTIIIMIIYSFIMSEIDSIINVIELPFISAVIYIGKLIIKLAVTVGGWFIFIAILDFSYKKFKHEKDLKMTKQEVKEEYKQTEGNPQIKGKIRQKMQEASMRRMMQDIPKADVIITNPTHYAVAIYYDQLSGKAPKVTAKGVDHLAERIKKVARENNVEIVENRQLARALYASVDIGKEIPPELYKAVAEVLAFVYKLKNKI